MTDKYIMYDPADFAKIEIKPNEDKAEILRLRAENEKLRAAVLKADEFIQNGIELGYIREPKMVDDPGYYTPSIVRAAAAGAIRETG